MTRSAEATKTRGYRVTAYSGHRRNPISGWFADRAAANVQLRILADRPQYAGSTLKVRPYWLDGGVCK